MNLEDRILITGASGMVGKSLTATLINKGFGKLLTPSSRDLDCRNQEAVLRYLEAHRPSCIFHLAGHIGGIKASIERPVEFMYENLMMGMNVIAAAREHNVSKLLNVGSSCIYPRESKQPMREDYILGGSMEPTNEGYAIAKIAAIKLCEYMNKQFGTKFFTVIPCNLYGVNDHFETENSHVVSALMFKMHQAKLTGAPKVEVWGTGNTRREFLYVDDFAQAMIYFMQTFSPTAENCFFNVGAGVDQTVRDLAFLIRDVVGYGGELEFNSSKPDGMPKKLMDVSKAKSLGWSASTDLRRGLQKTYDWYLESLT